MSEMLEEKSKVYVGNLEYSVTEDEIKSLFEEKGISAKEITIIKDKYTGRSKGFGFVEVGSDEEVQKAVEALNDQDLKGRKLKISKARELKQKF